MNAALEHALRLAEEAEHDPIAAVQNSGEVVRALRTAGRSSSPATHRGSGDEEPFARSFASLGVTHIVRATPVPELTPTQTTTAIRLDWPAGRGIVRSMFAGTLDGDPASLSRISLRISVNGSEELITTGEAEAFAPLIALQPTNHNWLRLKDFDVSAQQKWAIYFRYEATSGPPITPFLLFGYARVSA